MDNNAVIKELQARLDAQNAVNRERAMVGTEIWCQLVGGIIGAGGLYLVVWLFG